MSNSSKLPRGIRNNNPGNIRRSQDPWQGLSEVQTDKDFFQFKSMAYGIRALAKVLITYQDKYGLQTIADMINRYAPPLENDTKTYALIIASLMKRKVTDKINTHDYQDLKALLAAIIQQENGALPKKYMTNAVMDKGLMMAGVEAKAKRLWHSRTIRGTAIAAGAGSTIAYQAINDSWQHLSPALPFFERLGQYWPWVSALLMVAGIAWIIWAKLDDRRRGL